MPNVFIARQPIFDRELLVAGYELLFRGANQNVAIISDHDEATSTVVMNAFTEIGLDNVVGDRRAWINVSRDFLLEGLHERSRAGGSCSSCSRTSRSTTRSWKRSRTTARGATRSRSTTSPGDEALLPGARARGHREGGPARP